MDWLAELLASTGGPWRSCHTPDIIGLLILAATLFGVLFGYCMGKSGDIK